eukprot:TRINITY_DN47241_c0_g1_i1.p1 TRINITY_DN47241_c0_g1~~TRINITY_DN47241_c0_g1_i1.p1  ORF type:complete len:1373 (+),score=329.81 TRINITY_DN47241_c0_g1_i1:229-4347(+)
MEGAKVYVHDNVDSWRKATVVAALGGGKYRVQLESWEDKPGVGEGPLGDTIEVDASKFGDGGSLPFQNAGMPDNGFPNMTILDHLHEAAILHNLRVRFFASSNPYTYTADIVIAMNPYRWFPHLFSEEMRKEYLVFDRDKLTPHVYATSSTAYSGLQEMNMDQSILVSGESGAGKTETVKILLAHLAFIASSDDTSHIKKIVESNPLLESFGNAQTVRNDNSSRFGKFIELELDETSRLSGSKCRTFLLEKSRVVGQDSGERGYHIFYQMMAADAERRQSFGLGDASYTRDSMRYTRMGASKTDTIEGKSDLERFNLTVSALALVGVEGEILTQLLKSLAGVLLLGQLSFDGEEEATISKASAKEAEHAAAALQVDLTAMEEALTTKSLKTRGEVFVKKLPPSSAIASCDALAKELYSRLFDWLVVQICAATSAPAEQSKRFVGMLDIFGFESFAINRFEQLCINFANEKLQQKFTMDVFKAVQQEYTEEGIPWEKIEFKDNAPVLALIESKLGVIAMLNEECVRPKGTEQNFVSKLLTVHKADPAFSTPRLGKLRELQFTITHYAGSVTYTTEGWLERNRDTVSDDIVALLRASKCSIITDVFRESASDAAESKASTSSTVATKFKNSLVQLMDTVGRTRTQYVRCIKPNKSKSPVEVDNLMVVEQLRCAGVIEAIRVSRAGFPARLVRADFLNRFGVLARAAAGVGFAGKRSRDVDGSSAATKSKAAAALSALKGGGNDAATCRALLSALLPDAEQSYEVGNTRVYFKMGVLEGLEERRALLMQAAANEISRVARGCIYRRRFLAARKAALRLQALQRMQGQRKAYLRTRACVVRVQSQRRAQLARRAALVLRRNRNATRLQAAWRRRVAVREYHRRRAAIVRTQAAFRRFSCRRQYLADLTEFKEQSKLSNQVKALQAKLLEAQEAARLAACAAAAAAAAGNGATVAEVPAPVASSAAAPSAEVLEALQALGDENAKLRMEVERQRSEIVQLRKENAALRASSSTQSYFVNFLKLQNKSVVEEERLMEATGSQGLARQRLSTNGSVDATPPPRATVKRGSLLGDSGWFGGASEDPQDPGVLELHPPLSEFWENVPCDGIPMLESGSEVHIKMGPNILYAEENGKNLMWRPWMDGDKKGYLRAMAFVVEKRAELRAESQRGSFVDEEPMDPYSNIGMAFAVRSLFSNKYLQLGGLLAGRCLQVTGERPDDAAVFTYYPISASEAEKDSGSAAAYAFALRLLGESKMLCLRKDSYVSMKAVSETDPDADIVYDSMAISLECLLPCTSYEITVSDRQVGITVGKDLPLRVVGFKPKEGDPPEPGEAESTGRVHVNDVITTVNGQDIEGIARAEAIAMINERRPVTLGFSVYN